MTAQAPPRPYASLLHICTYCGAHNDGPADPCPQCGKYNTVHPVLPPRKVAKGDSK